MEAKPHGVSKISVSTIGNPDFVKYAESYGASAIASNRPHELVPLDGEMPRDGRGSVIDVPVDYSENDRILNHEIQERSQRI